MYLHIDIKSSFDQIWMGMSGEELSFALPCKNPESITIKKCFEK